MSRRTPDVLEALRLPELYRKICLYAGIPLSPAPTAAERYVFRSGAELPDFFAKLLEEAFVEDEAEVVVCRATGPPDFHQFGTGHIIVLPGFDSPCPVAEELRRAVWPGGGPVLLFAIERRDGDGRLLGVTWAAVPEEEPAPETPFRAAVLRDDTPVGP